MTGLLRLISVYDPRGWNSTDLQQKFRVEVKSHNCIIATKV